MAHHRRGLRRLLKDDELAHEIALGDLDGLDVRRRAILAYVAKLTTRPAEMTRADVALLRDVGLEDEDVLAVCECAAYYAYANRIADGLGIELEPHVNEESP